MSDSTAIREFAQFGEGVWLVSDPVRIVGMRLTATMTIVRQPNSELLLHSPVALTNERRDIVESLGAVTHLYAPNTYHHAWIGDWARAFPKACVHGPSALRKKRPDLRIDRAHDLEAPSDLAHVFDEVHVEGFALEESVLVHRPSRSLIVADLVHNIGRPSDAWTQLYTRAMGFYDRVAISRMIRWTAFRNPSAARQSLDQLTRHHFDRLIVGHGSPLETDARDALLHAYDWLHDRRRPLLPSAPTSRRGDCG